MMELLRFAVILGFRASCFLPYSPPSHISSKFPSLCWIVGFVGLFSSGGQPRDVPVNIEDQSNLNCGGKYLHCLALVT
jgi:hypothetical protein